MMRHCGAYTGRGIAACRPDNYYNHPMDLLSYVLDTLRPQSSILGDWRLSGQWGLDIGEASGSPLHFVVEGECWLRRMTGELIPLHAGDLVMFPNWDRHWMLSCPNADAVDIRIALEGAGARPWVPGERAAAPLRLAIPGEGPATRILSVVVHFDRPSNSLLLRELPGCIHLTREQTRIMPLLYSILGGISRETEVTRPGFSTIAIRLSELVFIQVIRSYLLINPMRATGWLRTLSDEHLSAAMRALHSRIGRHWTVGALAYEAGLSRSGFAKRFKDLTGITPMDHVGEWRMHVAEIKLVSTRAPVAEVAREVGYRTTFSFSEAFKRRYLLSPGQYRKKHRLFPSARP
jgi:AraC-like DNA-binding protein